jgi:hypothetical protein
VPSSFVVSRRGLSSDLHLEPISPGPISVTDASILDMVDAVAEEMLDTVPGTSRRALEADAMRTTEMDGEQLAQLRATTEGTIAQRPPRDDATRPEMPIELIESERSIARSQQQRGQGVKIFVAVAIFLAVAASLWFFG